MKYPFKWFLAPTLVISFFVLLVTGAHETVAQSSTAIANSPPDVSITSPRNGENFPNTPATVIVNVSASDVDGMDRVEFSKDGERPWIDTEPACENRGTSCAYPAIFSFVFQGVAAGPHTFQATAYDKRGALATTSVLITVGTITVAPPGSLPCTAPTNIDLQNFANPCPVLSVSDNSVGASEPVTITLSPQSNRYLYKTLYVSTIKKRWMPKTLTTCGIDAWCTVAEGASHSLTLSAGDISALGGEGVHSVISWDYTWNGTCWLGPGATTCDLPGNWRVQTFEVGRSESPPATYILSIKKSGNGTVTGTGISCGNDCSETVPAGTTLSLRATPGQGANFGGWSLASCGVNLICTVTVDSNLPITATFTDARLNTAPLVNAGPDQVIEWPAKNVFLDGTVTDDGLPAGSQLSYSWTKVSELGTVIFGNDRAVDTTATFSAVGTYVLGLTVSDGSLSRSDVVKVIVVNNPNDATPPVIFSIDITPGLNQATFRWSTDEPATGQVLVGRTPDFGDCNTPKIISLFTLHSIITARCLLPNTTYYYRIMSSDAPAGGNYAESDGTFKTFSAI